MITLCQVRALQREFGFNIKYDNWGYITFETSHPAFPADEKQLIAQFHLTEIEKQYKLIYIAAVIHRFNNCFTILPGEYNTKPSAAIGYAPPLSYDQLRVHLKSLLEDFDYLLLYKKQLKLQQTISNISYDFK